MKDEPIFPVEVTDKTNIHAPMTVKKTGLTIRQHYAGLAMQGRLYKSQWHPEITAKDAVAYADALIAELKKDTTTLTDAVDDETLVDWRERMSKSDFEKARDEKFNKIFPDKIEQIEAGCDVSLREFYYSEGADWSREYTLKEQRVIIDELMGALEAYIQRDLYEYRPSAVDPLVKVPAKISLLKAKLALASAKEKLGEG